MPEARQFCTFGLGGLHFGVDVGSVQEVIRHREMTRVPTASPVARGLINLRGQIVLAVDLRHRLGIEAPRPLDESLHVIIRAGDRPTSLLVDEIGEILDLGGLAMEAPPETIGAGVRAFLGGIYPLPDRLLMVLDAARLVDFEAEATP